VTKIDSSAVNFTSNNQKKRNNIKGSIAAISVGPMASLAVAPFSLLGMNGMINFSKKLTKDEVKIVNEEEMIEIENKEVKVEPLKEEKETVKVVKKEEVVSKPKETKKDENKKEKQLTMSDFFEEFKI
jgi:hypothetical protein